MLTQPDLERAFRDHILGADLPASLLDALTHGPVVPAAEVLAIHRNTYALGLAEALGALFPAVRAATGVTFPFGEHVGLRFQSGVALNVVRGTRTDFDLLLGPEARW